MATKGEIKDSAAPEQGAEDITTCRAVAARLNNLSQDRPNITLATLKLRLKVLRLGRSPLVAQDLKNMSIIGWFLVEMPRVGCIEWQRVSDALHALADTDCAGDRG